MRGNGQRSGRPFGCHWRLASGCSGGTRCCRHWQNASGTRPTGHDESSGTAGQASSGTRIRRTAVIDRAGFTLFEVVLSVGIFFAAIAVIAQLVDLGTQAAIEMELKSEAMWRCESQMNELVSGAQPLQDTDGVACVDNPDWSWSLTTSEGPHPDLVALEVYVSHQRADGRVDADYLLRRYVRSPLVYEEAALAAEAAAAEAEAAEADQ